MRPSPSRTLTSALAVCLLTALGASHLADFATPPDYFAATLPGHGYALVGNAFSPGGATEGLTLTTDRVLTSLYVGYDDNGLGSSDADRVTVTAFGAGPR